jgi:hypothetical protein
MGVAKGVEMNNWQIEFMAEYHRREILEQVDQIRLERVALRSRVYRPRLFERTMFRFANWMVFTGKQLQKRYEVPTVHCNHSHSHSYVQQ